MSQLQLLEELDKLNLDEYYKVTTAGSIVFLPKGLEKSAMICAHLDTINESKKLAPPRMDELNLSFDFISLKQPTAKVLGGDDRCGVYIALQLMARRVPYSFGFFRDEEIGCQGSKKFKAHDKHTCFVGVDRRGATDVALYGYDNDELTSIFTKLGYEEAMGSITDASVLAGDCNLACVNLAIGYNHEHTSNEIIIPSHTERTLEILSMESVVEALNAKEYITAEKPRISYYGGDYSGYYADQGIGFGQQTLTNSSTGFRTLKDELIDDIQAELAFFHESELPQELVSRITVIDTLTYKELQKLYEEVLEYTMPLSDYNYEPYSPL